MTDPYVVWAEVLERLGLVPVGTVEDGLRYAVDTSGTRIEAEVRIFREPVTVRLVVRPLRHDGDFLLAPADRVRTPARWKTGDTRFDDRVAIVAGGRSLLPRLGPAERERLLEVVGEIGALVGAVESTLEPAMAARFTDAKDAMATVRDLVRITTRLASDPAFEELLDRFVQDDAAAVVTGSVTRRVLELLPGITEEQAALACRVLLDQPHKGGISLLALMPPYPCVLAAWFKLGDPLDPRVAARVVDAWRAGAPRPAARYFGWLLDQPGANALAVAQRLWDTPNLAEDQAFVKELVRAIRDAPPPAALPFLLQVQPRSSSIARRLARVLQQFPGAEVDRRLAEWLRASSGGTREAAAQALAERAVDELTAGGRRARLAAVQGAAEQSPELLAALVARVPPTHTHWLVGFRPHAEPDAISLIRRLGQGGADVDEALLYWLDRGTSPVRLEAARALGAAGSGRVVPALRERAGAWFSDGGVREACRQASEAIRRRVGGAGALAIAPPAGGELAVASAPDAGRLRVVGGTDSGKPLPAPPAAPRPDDG
jgi:hypothetical protein